MSDLPSEEEVRRRVERIQALMDEGQTELIGQSQPEAISLASPDTSWADEFERLRTLLRHALGLGVRIEHVGSTAIPGILAKPVIDIQVSVADINDEPAFVPQIESVGIRLRARESNVGHLYFRNSPRTTHIHVCQIGSAWERDHLLFRDFMRAHPDDARSYEHLKRAAATTYEHDRLAYTEAKGPFIESVLARAEEWAASSGWKP